MKRSRHSEARTTRSQVVRAFTRHLLRTIAAVAVLAVAAIGAIYLSHTATPYCSIAALAVILAAGFVICVVVPIEFKERK